MVEPSKLLILEKTFSDWPPSNGPVILDHVEKHNLIIEIIPAKGNFNKYNDYINYVHDNKNELNAELKYIKNHLEKKDSWGEILIVRDKNKKIIGSLGPNRIEKDEKGEKRARPGYFSVLKNFRNKKIGTALWAIGLKRMKKMGADYIKISVARDNLPAIKIYLNSGMEKIRQKIK